MNFLTNALSKYQLKKLIKELNTIDYDALIDGVSWLMLEFERNNEDDQYLKALYAIKECMIQLKKIYQPEKEEGQ